MKYKSRGFNSHCHKDGLWCVVHRGPFSPEMAISYKGNHFPHTTRHPGHPGCARDLGPLYTVISTGTVSKSKRVRGRRVGVQGCLQLSSIFLRSFQDSGTSFWSMAENIFASQFKTFSEQHSNCLMECSLSCHSGSCLGSPFSIFSFFYYFAFDTSSCPLTVFSPIHSIPCKTSSPFTSPVTS